MARPEQVIDQYTTSTARLRASLLATVLRLFLGLEQYRDADADGFVDQAVPVVLGAQRVMGALTDAYLAALITALTGQPTTTVGVQLAERTRGVDPVEVYRRPFTQIWTELAAGASMTEAVTAGQRRLEDLAATDLQLAKTNASRQALQARGDVVGYRRVLTGAENCGLCVVSATQRYHRAELLPIHPGCDCSVAPLVGDEDPGQVIDEQLLEAAHDAIADRFGQQAADRGARDIDYRKVLLVQEHGELGPVLTVAGHRFTGPDQIPG